jgi:transcriptional regulator of arginine metabolism
MKNARQQKIVELINSYDISTQDELAKALSDAGFNATQATISRDIRELNLTKVAAGNKSQKYAIPTSDNVLLNERFEGVLRQGFLSCDVAGNILVVKTVSGMAMAVGAAFDSLKWPEIIGAVAGDDTIICVIRTEKEAIEVMSRIRKFVSETPSRDGRDAK